MTDNMSSYESKGSGVINRIPEGWPTTPLPTRKRPPQTSRPTQAILDFFIQMAKMAIKEFAVFVDGFCDHDLDDFIELVNITVAQEPIDDIPLILQKDGFSKKRMESTLFFCDLENNKFR